MTGQPRLRDLGITVGTLPTGARNAITDVPEVSVGHTTVIHEDGPARTGVTAIHPHAGSIFTSMAPAAIEALNGSGEMTGRSQVDEYGLLESPILITNTLSVGTAHRACVEWIGQREPALGDTDFSIPVVAETYDGYLNDIGGQHVTIDHVFAALDSASDGPVAEGNVGGGTGMRLFEFKGGIGTASRMVEIGGARYTVGVLIQGNYGSREHLLVDGVPVGRELGVVAEQGVGKDGSVIVVIATDAPLTDRQLRRLCRRGMLGLARTGATANHTSGDILLAFSNAPENRVDRFAEDPLRTMSYINDSRINPFFSAAIEATEEAVLNALVAAETMTGRDGHTVEAIPHNALMDVMRRYNWLGK
ncbi:MAG TPA: P1 family peptidase [Thermomicrobiales bacterium]|nr:P1 family peptidase [Thermomicrobiales bacterium]